MRTEFDEEEEFCFNVLLKERLQKIRYTINYYGEENFYLSYSGGKDSCVLSEMIDIVFPNNKIPRVYADTGIELNMVRDFVKKQAETDDRIVIIKPSKNIKKVLEEEGYPFKSKEHSYCVYMFQRFGDESKVVQRYLYPSKDREKFACPKKLEYQFSEKFKLKISKKCCEYFKEKPALEWSIENNKPYAIVGLTQDEGRGRSRVQCLAFNGNKLKSFQPLNKVTKDWEDWFIQRNNVELCPIYYPPYNFPRTGCKGCPFALELQKELDVLEKHFPNERKQCETIWKPVYDEYRRIGYRLDKKVKKVK